MTEPSPGLKAVNYAEQTLNVHGIYAEAVKDRQALEEAQKNLLQARNRRRQLESYLRDREMEVTEEVTRQNPNESQAARDKLLKVALSNDGDVRETRDDLATLAGEVDFLEFEDHRLTLDVKIAVARMQELGGYFQYLAVVKQAQITLQSETNKGPST